MCVWTLPRSLYAATRGVSNPLPVSSRPYPPLFSVRRRNPRIQAGSSVEFSHLVPTPLFSPHLLRGTLARDSLWAAAPRLFSGFTPLPPKSAYISSGCTVLYTSARTITDGES